MPSFFKASCSVFWVIWMITLSLAFGTAYVETKYTYIQQVDGGIIQLMLAACLTCVGMAFVGCCSIKCDISHVCFAILYIVPMIGSVISLSSYVIYHCNNQSPARLDPGALLALVKKDFDSSNEIPGFLQYTQTHYRCCGIQGFKDYRAFLLPSSIKQDVPFSCCHNLLEGQADICTHPDEAVSAKDPDTLYDIYINYTMGSYTSLPVPLPTKKGGRIDKGAMNKLFKGLYGQVSARASNDNESGASDPDLGSGPHAGLLVKDENYPPLSRAAAAALWLPVKQDKKEAILTRGCYEDLKRNADNIVSYYFGLSIFLIICSILMSILFVQNCLKVRRLRTEAIQSFIETGKPPRASLLESNYTEEDFKEVLKGLKNPKTKLQVGVGGEPEGGGRRQSLTAPINKVNPPQRSRQGSGNSNGPPAPGVGGVQALATPAAMALMKKK